MGASTQVAYRAEVGVAATATRTSAVSPCVYRECVSNFSNFPGREELNIPCPWCISLRLPIPTSAIAPFNAARLADSVSCAPTNERQHTLPAKCSCDWSPCRFTQASAREGLSGWSNPPGFGSNRRRFKKPPSLPPLHRSHIQNSRWESRSNCTT